MASSKIAISTPHVQQSEQIPNSARRLAASPTTLTDLVMLAQVGDAVARDHVVVLMMPLVRMLARCCRCSELTEDLIQVGVVGSGRHGGLLRAIEFFDPSDGVPFSTYAAHLIEAAQRAELHRERRKLARHTAEHRAG